MLKIIRYEFNYIRNYVYFKYTYSFVHASFQCSTLHVMQSHNVLRQVSTFLKNEFMEFQTLQG